MKWIVLFGVNLIILIQGVHSFGISDNSIPSPPCCHSECCCSQCPRESCLRPPEDTTVLHPCSCDQALQYSCSRNLNPIYPTLLPLHPMNYQFPQLPYPDINNNNNNNNPRQYPVVVIPQPPQRPPLRRPYIQPDYMKPCLCGTVAPTCQQITPCSGIDPNNNYNGGNYGSWYSWNSWNLSFLETPQGIALLITAFVLLLLIICLIIGLIMACIRSRKSRVTQIERDYERHEKLNDNNFQTQMETKKEKIEKCKAKRILYFYN
uniref:Uncharacterized protein n=1 Tax=Panagrolaimus superbus TaxID=310955 RepID=A0A914YHX5_9BILA